MSYEDYEYDMVPSEDIEEYWLDENKFSQLPWEDTRWGHGSQHIDTEVSMSQLYKIVVSMVVASKASVSQS